ncbi:MAG: HAD hydrolase-like protein [Sutterella sp.]|nr:HAD hydrolase-like protein [Sutterella sp.]
MTESRDKMIQNWFLDLDDTLYEASGGMLKEIHLRMNAFIARELRMSLDEASALRTHFWTTYGCTFIGLWHHYHIDPVVFLTETHDFDPSPYIHYDGNPVLDVRRLSGKKIIFTNGPQTYAQKVISLLGLEAECDEVISCFEMKLFGDWRPKPNRSVLINQCQRLGLKLHQTALVDDTPLNLSVAKSVGMQTVWCTGYRFKHKRLTHRRPYAYVDYQVPHIRELGRLPQKPRTDEVPSRLKRLANRRQETI